MGALTLADRVKVHPMNRDADQGKRGTAAVWTPPEVIPHHHTGPCGCEPALAYVRVSQVGDREILISPDIQVDYCLKHAARTGRRIVKILSDINRSGQTFRKRSVEQCLRLIDRNTARGVIVWKWSRWGRNQQASLEQIEKTQAVGGWVESATEDFDLESAIGSFMRDTTMRIDQLMSDQIGENWKNAQGKRRDQGLPHGGRQRFGYDYTPATPIPGGAIPAKYTKNADEAPVLEKLYLDFMAGAAGPAAMTRRLNDLGFPTALGGKWTEPGVMAMLDTGFAAGLIRERSKRQLAQAKAARKSIRNSIKTFDVWRTGAHEPIIEMAVWERYKRKRLEQADLPPRARNAVHAMSSLLLCDICANRLCTKYAGKNRQHQWICPRVTSTHVGVPVSISDRAIQEIVLAWIIEHAQPSTDEEPMDDIGQRVYAESEQPARTRAQIDAEIKRWLKKLDRLVGMHTDDLIDRDTFLSNKTAYEDGVSKLRTELAELKERTGAEGRPPYEAFQDIAAMWPEATPPERHSLLEAVIKFIVVSPADGRGRWHDAAERVKVVGVWEAPSWERWLAARRKRIFA